MPMLYFDRKILQQSDSRHPALEVNETHPCYRMIREAVDGKSVFYFNREQAYDMYVWYHEGWKSSDLYDEFGESIPDFKFKEILAKSHYMVPEPKPKGVNKKMIPSDETIEDLFNAVTMERKILESIGEEDKDEDS